MTQDCGADSFWPSPCVVVFSSDDNFTLKVFARPVVWFEMTPPTHTHTHYCSSLKLLNKKNSIVLNKVGILVGIVCINCKDLRWVFRNLQTRPVLWEMYVCWHIFNTLFLISKKVFGCQNHFMLNSLDFSDDLTKDWYDALLLLL